MTVAASKALRVLLLTDENLIPDKPRSKLKGRDAELSKTEYERARRAEEARPRGQLYVSAAIFSRPSRHLRNRPHVT
jgi:hypothetical protein